MRIVSVRRRTKEGGAVMVEFSVAFIVLAMILALIIDLSFTYFRYNLLVFASQKVSRRIAVDVEGNNDAGTLAPAAQASLREYLGRFGVDPAQIGIATAAIEWDNGPSGLAMDRRCYLHIQGITWQSFSFLTAFFQTPFTIRTKTRVLIEDPCFVC